VSALRGGGDVAIVGMACRFPGAANLAEYWRLLVQGRNATREVPGSRWSVGPLYDPDAEAPGKTHCLRGGFLDDVAGFDWRSMRMAPREALHVDPQHRLLLEVVWEAFEDAGLPLEAVAGSNASVHVGIGWNDYLRLRVRDWSKLSGYDTLGNPFAFAANRVSHMFDLRGPSAAIDAACVSSLVALKQACDGLRFGTQRLAVVAGVNLLLSPDASIMLAKSGVLSATGQCRPLDERADGFLRGEGCGAIVLKRFEDVGPGDRVYACIPSVALGHNGRNEWIMAASAAGQSATLRGALEEAGCQASDVGYVELHGTGFLKGDVTELRAVASALGSSSRAPCPVGSVKGNIGSLEAAAGMASIIKVALCIDRRTLVPTGNFARLNPAIDVDALRLVPQCAAGPWDAAEGHMPAGVVCGTSLGGANAHAVLRGVPAHRAARLDEAQTTHVLPISARTPEALRAYAAAVAEHLVAKPAPSLRDVCYTAAHRRTHHPVRYVAVGASSGSRCRPRSPSTIPRWTPSPRTWTSGSAPTTTPGPCAPVRPVPRAVATPPRPSASPR
jgi:acyl transferase domain-containing protein